jgi:hypothetical protein
MYVYISLSCISVSHHSTINISASQGTLRQDAIKKLTSYIEAGDLDSVAKDPAFSSSSLLVVVKEQTRGFRETNAHVLKAIMNFLLAVMEFCESRELLLPQWASIDIADVCVERISDRKLSEVCKTLLSTSCVVSEPSLVILHALQHLEKNVKSPVAHEEMMKWLRSFCNDFGAALIGSKIGDIIPLLLEVRLYVLVRLALTLLFARK